MAEFEFTLGEQVPETTQRYNIPLRFDDADVMADAFCGRSNAPDYSRVLNPTVTHFEDRVAALTGAKEVSAFSSGMAAISAALFSTAAAGKNIISSRHMFGNTYLLLTQTMHRFNVEARLCDLTNIEEVQNLVDQHTCCIYLETVTNPQMEVADVRELAKIARRYNIPVIADTTVVSPDASLEHSTDLDMLREYMSQLDARELVVLNGRYGLDGGEEKTLAAIGAELGVTREWIRQIEIQAIKKLRRSLKDRLVVLHQS